MSHLNKIKLIFSFPFFTGRISMIYEKAWYHRHQPASSVLILSVASVVQFTILLYLSIVNKSVNYILFIECSQILYTLGLILQ